MLLLKRYKDHPYHKMINQNVSVKSLFNFKGIWKSDIQKEVSNLDSKKAGTSANIAIKVMTYMAHIIYSL